MSRKKTLLAMALILALGTGVLSAAVAETYALHQLDLLTLYGWIVHRETPFELPAFRSELFFYGYPYIPSADGTILYIHTGADGLSPGASLIVSFTEETLRFATLHVDEGARSIGWMNLGDVEDPAQDRFTISDSVSGVISEVVEGIGAQTTFLFEASHDMDKSVRAEAGKMPDASVTPGEDILDALWALFSDANRYDETIEAVYFRDDTLWVRVDLGESELPAFSYVSAAVNTTSAFAYALLDEPAYDDYWNGLVFDYGVHGYISCYKEEVQENLGGRFFDSAGYVLHF